MCNSFMFCYNRTEGGDFMPVGVLTNVCAVFIGTFIGGFLLFNNVFKILLKKYYQNILLKNFQKYLGFVQLRLGLFLF